MKKWDNRGAMGAPWMAVNIKWWTWGTRHRLGAGRLWRIVVNTNSVGSDSLVSKPTSTPYLPAGPSRGNDFSLRLSASSVKWGFWWELRDVITATVKWDTPAVYLTGRPGGGLGTAVFIVWLMFLMVVLGRVLWRNTSLPIVLVC